MGKFMDSTGANLLWNKVKNKVDRIIGYYNIMRQRYIALQDIAGGVVHNSNNVTIGNTYSGALDDIETNPVTINEATTETAGVMSADDKAKLDRFFFGPEFTYSLPAFRLIGMANNSFALFVTDKVLHTRQYPFVIHGIADRVSSYVCTVQSSTNLILTISGGGVGGYFVDYFSDEVRGTLCDTSVTLNGVRDHSTGEIEWAVIDS
ncbi:MAG: hypothetical protein NC344_10290 [Bacteroidales bacterium]|nr:hypothetical protein [Bacteroidales bacterium]MCM1148193.1 hypothetical protein [Bacteroidales bacterium]MCM1207080.1 hypothetical protein [Bacillota bacterium]MCM1510824.1 hypothetical protein [Clostridium sp.]